MASDNRAMPHKWRNWRSAAWWPAIPLLGVQLINGLRETPQFTFFLLYLEEDLDLAPATIAGIVASAQFAGMVTALLSGAIAARLGSKWMLVCGLVLAGISSLVFQVESFWVVVLLWLLGGAGLALTSVGGASYLTRLAVRASLGVIAALYALSVTAGGAIGNLAAGLLIEARGFAAFGWVAMALSAAAILVVVRFMAPLHDAADESAVLRSFWSDALAITRRPQVRMLIGLRALPTIFYGMLSVLIPLLLNELTGSKVMVAAYGTTTLVVASAAQLVAGRAADRWSARVPTLVSYAALILAGVGLAASVGTVAGLFVFGVLGIAAAWALAALMYVWVADGVPKGDHPSTFGLLHAVWSLSMIVGSVFGGWFVATAPGLPFLVVGLLNVGALFLTTAYYRHVQPKAPGAEVGG